MNREGCGLSLVFVVALAIAAAAAVLRFARELRNDLARFVQEDDRR